MNIVGQQVKRVDAYGKVTGEAVVDENGEIKNLAVLPEY